LEAGENPARIDRNPAEGVNSAINHLVIISYR
jgi:hypothetical protein